MTAVKKNILFVCTGNSCRSVMAEGLFRHLLAKKAGDFLIGSAGVNAIDGYPASQETIHVMKTHGVDVSKHLSRRLTAAMVRTADKIYVMETVHKAVIQNSWPEAAEKIHLLSEYSPDPRQRDIEIDIPDPIRFSESFYKNVFQVIRSCIAEIVKKMEVL